MLWFFIYEMRRIVLPYLLIIKTTTLKTVMHSEVKVYKSCVHFLSLLSALPIHKGRGLKWEETHPEQKVGTELWEHWIEVWDTRAFLRMGQGERKTTPFCMVCISSALSFCFISLAGPGLSHLGALMLRINLPWKCLFSGCFLMCL